MIARTRYVVITSLLVLAVGLGSGLVAYYGGFTTSAFFQQGGPEELKFVPANASLVAYADVQHIMTSGLRQKLRTIFPERENGHQELQDRTGINVETDIDRVVVFVAPAMESDGKFPGTGMMLARGRFDVVKIEALMREHGGQAEEYKGKRLVVAAPREGKPELALGFLEAGLVAVGTNRLVRGAVDLRDGGSSLLTNDEMMNRIRDLDTGDAWVAGRFEELTAQTPIPSEIRSKLPPIVWFSGLARVNESIGAMIKAETRDDESANGLRDVVRGIVALARLQAGSRPEFQALLQSLELGGTGNAVSLSFDLPVELLDTLQALTNHQRRSVRLESERQPGDAGRIAR
jgi:hypothetical protein